MLTREQIINPKNLVYKKPELMNDNAMHYRLAVNGRVKVEHFGRLGGIVPDPDEIVAALKEQLIK